ncbi:MAG: 2TM domain-containing protein [Flavobacteriaceae bacterium]|nr:2TM domain-containing protein [Flavobacteriaceae bacterium]
MEDLKRETAFLNAKKRVNKLKGFYNHLAIYIFVNALITGLKMIKQLKRDVSFETLISDIDISGVWLLWGFGLVIHGFTVFVLPKIIGVDWEERKIRAFMEAEENNKI